MFLGGTIQSSLDFRLGIFALPTLISMGKTLPESVMIIALSSFFQTSWTSFLLRKNIPWKSTKKAVFLRILFVPLGILFLAFISKLAINDMKQITGIMLLSIIIFQISPRKINIKKSKIDWSYIAFPLSGFMSGSLGIGGPPMVLWSMNSKLSQIQIRSFLLTTFALTLPVTLTILFISFPHVIKSALLSSVFAIPSLALGIKLGLYITNKLNMIMYKRALLILMFLLSLGLILKPFLDNLNISRR